MAVTKKNSPAAVCTAVMAITFTLTGVAPANEDRLIDKSIEPPTEFSPDFAESTPAPVSPVPHAVRGGPAVPAARQPAGALSGRIVFTNGGHGWTWDPDYWRTQRGVTQEMNEDCGNLDQMNLFAMWCFNAGAVVVPMRPVGQQVNEVVLDNDDAEVTYSGTWSDSTSTVFFGSAGNVPYRFTSLADSESATAAYTPNIPARGFYPVYTWVRHGPDRGDQLYRIRHTGGETQVRIPHHMVGNGWVYLGEYYLEAGSNPLTGSVIISNLRGSATGGVIIADAIRFGNGMGTVDRGTGVSTYPSEQENCRYWFQRNLAQGQSTTIYNGGGNDESDSWSAPPKMSAEMNREAAGSVHDRIHISFHSNAGGGRGTVALITGTPTANQTRLAQLCGREVNDDLVSLGSPPLEVAWQNRGTITYSGGYSEIDGSLFDYEMDATIIEVAFHDSVDDARLMRDVRARSAVGKAAMHAVIKYMNEFAGGPLIFPPDAPTSLRAQAAANGTVILNWTAPVSTGGSGAPAGYAVYRSTNGYGFGAPLQTGNVTSATVTGLIPGADYYFRVAAVNAGGESFPGEVVGCRPPAAGDSRQVLFVNAFDRQDRTLNLRQDNGRQAYAPPDATGGIERVLPQRSNSFDYVVQHGRAVSNAGYAFDSCQNEHVAAGTVALTDYSAVIWACGQESVADETFSAVEQTKITAFRTAGGHLLVSGSEIAWDLDRASGPASADRTFLNGQLKADLGADASDDSGSYTVNATAAGIFAGMPALTFDDGTRGLYPVKTPDILTPLGGAVAALTYEGVATGAAAIQYISGGASGRVVYLGFPFETITGSAARSEVMRRILAFFDPSSVIVAAGSPWKYLDTGAIPAANWTTDAFDDSAWPSGPAQLGFGEGDEATPLIANPARITTWLRRSFNVTGLQNWTGLRVHLLRDDGAVVYLNGHELLRSNLPETGDILPGTQALASVGGADENIFLTYPAGLRFLREGPNILAVELHQAGTASSDLSFDLALTGTQATPVPLIPAGSVWKYRDNNVQPSAPWVTAAYNDAAWNTGLARLGYGGDGELTMLGYGIDPDNVFPVTWFRHVFTVPDAAAFQGLQLDLQRDDGAIVWLNGTELTRDNLRSGPVTATTFATAAIGGADEQSWRTFTLPSSALVTGPNAIAVQIHQVSANSSDIGFDLRLSGLESAFTTFAEWQSSQFGSDAASPLAGDLADPDLDGRVNLLEYASGTRPDNYSPASSPSVSTGAGRLVFRFNRNSLAADLTYTVQAATSPAGPWTAIASSTGGGQVQSLAAGVSITESPAGSLRQVEVRDAVDLTNPPEPRRFLRLAVTR